MQSEVQGRFPLATLTAEEARGLSVRFSLVFFDGAAEKHVHKILISALAEIP